MRLDHRNRDLLFEEDGEHYRVRAFTTGAVYLSHKRYDKQLLVFTNALELIKAGYLRKLIKVMTSDDVLELHLVFKKGLTLDHSEKFDEALKFILDSDLKNTAKFLYIASLYILRVPFLEADLREIFKNRPDPLEEITALDSNQINENTYLSALIPGLFLPEYRSLRTIDDYKRFSLTAAFLSSTNSIRFKEFFEKNEEKFFQKIAFQPELADVRLYKPVKKEDVADYYPSEFRRYMLYSHSVAVRELRSWAKKRFDRGVETVNELRQRLSTNDLVSRLSPNWMNVLRHLSLDEANAFMLHLADSKSFTRLFNGIDNRSGCLFAYFWAEGGPERFEELLAHVASSFGILGSSEQPARGAMMWKVAAEWENPYRPGEKKLDIMPYIKVLENESLDGIPLEIALATV